MGFNYFGENKAQLFRDKIKTIDNPELTWDFYRTLAKIKIKYIIKRVNLIHSIDTISLLEEVNEKPVKSGEK